ncbi:MAG: NAD(P)-dependent oxidoreductase, partial [Nanoarchaeota archaeon]|nr:NAD(P)-dependent oxidoreductase [Nanoarchaeota archaeon]
MKNNVLIAMKSPFAEDARIEAVDILEKYGFNVTLLEKYCHKSDLIEAVRDTNILIVRSDIVDDEIINAGKNLDLIVRAGSGTDNIKVSLDALRDEKKYLMSTPGTNARAVAELVFALILRDLRYISQAHDALVNDGKSIKKSAIGRELFDKKIGIYGLGQIGPVVAQIANGFGMNVFAFDPYVSEKTMKELGVKKAGSLEDLCEGAFVLTLHAKLTGETRNSVTRNALSYMKDDGMLVNLARNEIVHKESIDFILQTKKSFRYYTDFGTENEMENVELAKKHPGRVTVLPHIGASTHEANQRTIVTAANQIVDYVFKGNDAYILNKEVVPMRFRNYADLAVKLGLLGRELASGTINEVQLICYDELKEYTNEFYQQVLKGLFAKSHGWNLQPDESVEIAANANIVKKIKAPEIMKNYGNSLTVDVSSLNGDRSSISIRGTVYENTPMIVKIGDFHKVKFVPEGKVAVFMYSEREGMMDTIGRYFTDYSY